MGILESLVGFGLFVVVMERCILTCCFVAQTFLSEAIIAQGQELHSRMWIWFMLYL